MRYEWTLCFLDSVFIWEDDLKYAQVMRCRLDLRHTIFAPRCARLSFFFSFLKDNIAGVFSSQKLNFVQRLWQIAAAAQNGLVRCDLCQVGAV